MKNTNTDTQWYIVQCISNHETRVRDALGNRVISEKLEDKVEEIYLPMMTGSTPSGRSRIKPLFPGYIFIKMIMDDDSWFIIRNTKDVTGIVGSSGARTKPTPVPSIQIKKIVNKIAAAAEAESKKTEVVDASKPIIPSWTIGTRIIITSESLQDKEGEITAMDNKSQTAQIRVELFGRLTPVEVAYKDIKKIAEDKDLPGERLR